MFLAVVPHTHSDKSVAFNHDHSSKTPWVIYTGILLQSFLNHDEGFLAPVDGRTLLNSLIMCVQCFNIW